MESLIQADIFFFITGIAVIIFASACVVAVVYLIFIFRDVRYIIGIVRSQADKIQEGTDRVLGWLTMFKGRSNKKTTTNGRKKE